MTGENLLDALRSREYQEGNLVVLFTWTPRPSAMDRLDLAADNELVCIYCSIYSSKNVNFPVSVGGDRDTQGPLKVSVHFRYPLVRIL